MAKHYSYVMVLFEQYYDVIIAEIKHPLKLVSNGLCLC